MKNVKVFLVAYICCFVFVYILFSFSNMTLSPEEMGQGNRNGISIVSICMSILIMLIKNEIDSKGKE